MSHTVPTSGSPESTSGIMDVLRNRNFLYLWIAQALSQSAQQVMNYVLLQHAFALSKSSTALSIIMICFTVPAILFSAVAGVFVDRIPKRTVLTTTNALRTLAMLAYVLFAGPDAGVGALTVVYIATLFFASVSQFFNPAEGSAIPLLVRRDQLVSANALFNLTFTASQFIGFLILGPLMVKIIASENDFGPIYVMMGALFLVCTGLTWLLPKNEQIQPEQEDRDGDGIVRLRERVNSVVDDLVEGWHYIRGDRAIFAAIIQWSVAIAVLFMMGVVGPGFLEFEVGINPHDLYIVLFPGGIGLIAGVALVSRLVTRYNRLRLINFSMLGAGIGLMLLASVGTIVRFIGGLFMPGASSGEVNDAVSPWLIVSIMIVTFGLGVLNSLISVPAQTTLQDHSSDDIRARVFGAFYTIQNIVILVPLVLVGAMADSLGVVTTISIMALAVIAVALWGLRNILEPAGEQQTVRE